MGLGWRGLGMAVEVFLRKLVVRRRSSRRTPDSTYTAPGGP